MSADITSAAPVNDERPYGSVPEERGSLGTLSWPRAAQVAGLAGAVAALAVASAVAGHMVHTATPARAHSTPAVVSHRAPVP